MLPIVLDETEVSLLMEETERDLMPLSQLTLKVKRLQPLMATKLTLRSINFLNTAC